MTEVYGLAVILVICVMGKLELASMFSGGIFFGETHEAVGNESTPPTNGKPA